MIRGVAEAGRALEVSILYQKCRQKRRQASVLPTRLGRPHSLIVSSLHLCVTPPFLFPRSPPHQARPMLCQYTRTAQPQALIATLTSLPLLFASSAWAAPLSSLAKRGSDGAGSKIIVRPFIPQSRSLLAHPVRKAPIIVVVVFVIVVPALFYRKSLLSQLRKISFYSVLAPHHPPTTVQVRDLTAEEIAGTAATAQAQAAATARTERRARRTRRTPSQISTRSLPAYMKEPGDLELVIIQ